MSETIKRRIYVLEQRLALTDDPAETRDLQHEIRRLKGGTDWHLRSRLFMLAQLAAVKARKEAARCERHRSIRI